MRYYSRLMHWYFHLPNHYAWLVKNIAVFFLAIGLSFLLKVLHDRLVKHFKKTHKLWDDVLVYSLYRPLFFLVWLLTFASLGDSTRHFFHRHFVILLYTDRLRYVGVMWLFLWFLFRFIDELSTRLVDPIYCEKPYEKTTVEAVSKFLIFITFLLMVLVGLEKFGVPLSGVLAFGGGSALIVGFAARGLLSNFFGGLLIYLERPFSVGDWVSSPDRELEGTIEHIGWRLTRIRPFDRRPLYVPNSIFSSIIIKNHSRMTNRRIKFLIGVRYEDFAKVPAIVADIEDMLINHPEIDTRRKTFAKVESLGDSSINIQVYTFTKSIEWLKFQSVQEDILLKITDIIYNKHQAAVSAPTRSLELPDVIPVKLEHS